MSGTTRPPSRSTRSISDRRTGTASTSTAKAACISTGRRLWPSTTALHTRSTSPRQMSGSRSRTPLAPRASQSRTTRTAPGRSRCTRMGGQEPATTTSICSVSATAQATQTTTRTGLFRCLQSTEPGRQFPCRRRRRVRRASIFRHRQMQTATTGSTRLTADHGFNSRQRTERRLRQRSQD